MVLPSGHTLERHSISLIGFSVFFGALVGFSVLLTIFYANGTFSENRPATENVPSGMEILEAYQCRKAETKQMIVGGVEDGFDPAGIEPSNPSEKIIHYVQQQHNAKARSEIVKTYDESIQDRYFSDRFDMPRRTFHGVVVVRLKELSSLKNDGISIGYNPDADKPYVNHQYGYGNRISNLQMSVEWSHHESLFFANLEDLKVSLPSEEKQTLLDVIRTQDDSHGPFFVDIADDTIVDFVGFSLCLEPEDNKGTVYSPHHPTSPRALIELGSGNLGLYTARVEDKICGYGGCLSCEEERPLACIHDTNMPLPDNHIPEYAYLWSGGELDFTKAVKGSSFITEDDVDQFCAAEFGSEWRALSRHDGHWGGSVSGRGTFPADYEHVWVNVKDSDHHNCWTTRPNYEASDD